MEQTRGDTAFLIGAGRSGTTLLYKLLCLHPHVAYTSNLDERLPRPVAALVARLVPRSVDARLGAWFDGGGNAYFVRRPWAKRLFPTPVEGEGVYGACGMPLFPGPGYVPPPCVRRRLRARFEGIRRACGAALLLSKRTANNRRIPALEATFPEARYIHMIRDGREVADSLARVEWWGSHTLWWDGRTADQAERAGAPRLTLAARNWVLELSEIRRGLAGIPSDRVLEVRYEDLLARPLDVLRGVLAFLNLEQDRAFIDAVGRLRLHHRPGSWAARWTRQELEDVLREAQTELDGLGYVQRGSA